MRLERVARRPLQAAAHTSGALVLDQLERAVDALLEAGLPEAVAASVVRHDVLRRTLGELLDTGTAGDPSLLAERADELGQAVAQVAERVLAEPAFRAALAGTLGDPGLRKALARQQRGFLDDVAAALRIRVGRLDDGLERVASRPFRHTPVPAAVRYGGLVSRGLALALDAALAHLVFLIGALTMELVLSLVGARRSGWLPSAVAGTGWVAVMAGYFVCFWSTTGQTPGLRALGLRVVGSDGGTLSAGRSLLRLGALVVAIVPFFAGFVPVAYDRRRRGLQDLVAHTVVRRVAEPESVEVLSRFSAPD